MSDQTGNGNETETADRDPEAAVERAESDEDEASDAGSMGTRARRVLLWVGVGVCALVALFAVVGAYQSIHDAVYIWIADEYQPLFNAAFDLVVLCIAGLVASRLVDRADALR
ncbi:hypothetical protein [Halocalculus aciditolerans]|uniref:DUF8060 domain-containing protein n=1 Tax=Halocalculus aciditolerans TaxID=1383812 RepID=A0A830FC87_9EURY|nr:hypothetical protein [Halocalculus aciditolerans]GGL60422.1 hypothetical protein GCM10009039_18340 [Halocalculus aciditolerans]